MKRVWRLHVNIAEPIRILQELEVLVESSEAGFDPISDVEQVSIADYPNCQPTPDILLCKSKDKVVVEYALSDIHKPMGVSEYELTRALPDELKSALPTIDQIEAELQQRGKECDDA